MTQPPRPVSSVDHQATADNPSSPDKSPSTRLVAIGVYVALLALAVAVAWTTQGRDPGQSADASVATALPSSATELSVTPEQLAIAEASPSLVAAAPTEVPAVQVNRVAADEVVDLSAALDTPHVVSSLASAVRVTASYENNGSRISSAAAASRPVPKPTVTPAVKLAAASPAEPFDPMIAIPQPGATFPAQLARSPEDDPHYHHGGLYGTPGATRLVYVIDASGSLIDTLPFILKELQKSIDDLRIDQSYAVLFFNGSGVLEAPPVGMKRANALAVRHTREWIDPSSGRVIASGLPNANAAIRRALAYQPDAVIMLSDGLTGRGSQALSRRAELLSLIEAANTKNVVFHTLQVRRPDPLASPTRLGTLELIALQSGGMHRYFSEEDLLPESP